MHILYYNVMMTARVVKMLDYMCIYIYIYIVMSMQYTVQTPLNIYILHVNIRLFRRHDSTIG